VGMPAMHRAVVRGAPAGAHGARGDTQAGWRHRWERPQARGGDGGDDARARVATGLFRGGSTRARRRGLVFPARRPAGRGRKRVGRSAGLTALRAVPGYGSLIAASFVLGAVIFATTGHVVLHIIEAVAAGPGLAGLRSPASKSRGAPAVLTAGGCGPPVQVRRALRRRGPPWPHAPLGHRLPRCRRRQVGVGGSRCFPRPRRRHHRLPEVLLRLPDHDSARWTDGRGHGRRAVCRERRRSPRRRWDTPRTSPLTGFCGSD
jgi:hypothetical protein